MKKHRMLFEMVRKEATEHGAIGITESAGIMKDIGKVVKKYKYDCYAKGLPKKVIDYKPTGKTYELDRLVDVVDLTSDQFEMFIEDFRNWFNIMRSIRSMNEKVGEERIKNKYAGMKRIDSGKHEAKVKFEGEITNSL